MSKIITICFVVMLFAGLAGNALGQGVGVRIFTAHFNFNAFDLAAEGRRAVDSAAEFILNTTDTVKHIEISGYCDSVGSLEYNQKLSIERAGAVATYLRGRGIDSSRLCSVAAYGKQRPLNNNRDEQQRAANRRVEIRVETVAAIAKKPEAVVAVDSAEMTTIDLSHVEVNDILTLENLQFFPDRHMIMEESKKNLRKLLRTMQANPTLRIEIRGHVCCVPGRQGDAMDEDTYTPNLSLQRSREIYLYLAENGIDKSRMQYVGLGSSHPLVKEFTDADRAKNRRVEIKILGR